LPIETTNVDPAPIGWVIDDPVIRFRILGSERVFDLATGNHWVLGSSPESSLRLDDPSGRVSRRHAEVLREGESWRMVDLGSTNGLRVNSERHRSIHLAPADEIVLGGVTLIAESHRSMELHELLRRWLGWSTSRLGMVDRALREVRAMANLRTALILRGVGELVGVARRLHRVTLGDRPFIPFDWNEYDEQGLHRAINGTLYIDARGPRHKLGAAPINFRALDLRVRLVGCIDSPRSVADLAAMLYRIAILSIPSVTERRDEIERLLVAYGSDAVTELGASWHGFQPSDPDRVFDSGIATLDELEAFARRLVALRNWGVTDGAKRLGITHAAMLRWARRWKISVFRPSRKMRRPSRELRGSE
jgi:hypothetical protein